MMKICSYIVMGHLLFQSNSFHRFHSFVKLDSLKCSLNFALFDKSNQMVQSTPLGFDKLVARNVSSATWYSRGKDATINQQRNLEIQRPKPKWPTYQHVLNVFKLRL